VAQFIRASRLVDLKPGAPATAQPQAKMAATGTKAERDVQKQYWLEHSTEPTVEAMMLDSNAAIIDQMERPEVRPGYPPAAAGHSACSCRTPHIHPVCQQQCCQLHWFDQQWAGWPLLCQLAARQQPRAPCMHAYMSLITSYCLLPLGTCTHTQHTTLPTPSPPTHTRTHTRSSPPSGMCPGSVCWSWGLASVASRGSSPRGRQQ
jgi:hypothetical protein